MNSSNSSRNYVASSVSSRNKLMNLHKELSLEPLYTFDVDQRNGHEEYPDATSLQFESFLSRINSKNINVNIGEETDNVKDTIDEEDFHDSDYNISGEDDDFQEVIVVNKNVKGKGRPKIAPGSINAPSSSAIVVPPQVVDTESDYVDSDEMLEEVESEKEEDKLQEKVTYVEYNSEKHKDEPILELGMTFGNFTEFKQACMEWGIKNRRELKFYPNDTERVVCICKRKDCPFRIYASKLSQDDPTVQIKSINLTHKGGMVFDNPHMTPKYIARRYFEIFKVDPNWSINGIIATVRKDLNYTISYKKAWRAKDQALKWVVGDESLQYGKLLSYRAELLNSNPGSTVVIWRNEEKFQGFYVCFGALKEAFKSGCRPFISLDGCWLKGNFGGNLLSAVAIDPNDCIFPVAYVVIAQNESKETWSWFLEILSEDLEIRNSHHIAFMSDRQKGLIGAVKDLFPFAKHRSCVRHMYQNFRGKHKGKALKDLVWSAAIASNEITFKKCMEKIEQEDREARNWFNHPERPFQSWTRALFKTNIRCDMLLTNLCESFNKYILDARDKPIITMLEMIKNKLMKRLHSKRIWIEKYQDKICPKIVKKLNKISNEAVMFKPDYSGGPKVLVNGPGGPYVVDMMANSCTCRRFELTGLPCPHAYISIIDNGEKVEDYVNPFYHIDTFKNVYSHYINPTNHEDHWPKILNGGQVFPPNVVKKKRGRKPKNRKKEPEELEKQKAAETTKKRARKKTENMKSQKLSKKGFVKGRCSICKEEGHNAKGHYNVLKRVVGTSSNQSPDQTLEQAENDDFWDYSKCYHPEK